MVWSILVLDLTCLGLTRPCLILGLSLAARAGRGRAYVLNEGSAGLGTDRFGSNRIESEAFMGAYRI